MQKTKTCNTCDWGYKKWFFSTPVCNHPTVIEAFDPVDGKPVPCERARSAQNYSPCGQHALCYKGPATINPTESTAKNNMTLTSGMITASMAMPPPAYFGSSKTVSLGGSAFGGMAMTYLPSLSQIPFQTAHDGRSRNCPRRYTEEESSSGDVLIAGGSSDSWSGGGGGFSGGGATGEW